MRKQKGITLIALVITIIVLLILAGVSIAAIVGENGIVTKTKNAEEETTRAEELEKVRLAIIASKTNENFEIEKTVLEKELNSYFGEGNYELTGSTQVGYFEIKLAKNTYRVDLNGNIQVPSAPTSIIIEGGNFDMYAGESIYLWALQGDGSPISDEDIEWTSLDTTIATVTPTTGQVMVTGIKKGEVKIRATSIYDENIYGEITIIVNGPESISISGWVSYFKTGDSVYLTAKDENGTTLLITDVTWETSDSSIASVENFSGLGYVTGISGGTVTITARSTVDSTIFAYVVFTVTDYCNTCDDAGTIEACSSCEKAADFSTDTSATVCLSCYEEDPSYFSAARCLECGTLNPTYISSEGGYTCCSEPNVISGGWQCCTSPNVSTATVHTCKNCSAKVYGSIYSGITNIDCPDCDN